MKRLRKGLLLAAMIVYSTTPAFSAILVVSTKGDAAYKEGGHWKPLAKGQELKEGVQISTGVNSQAVLNIDEHMLTIKPLTMIKVYKNSLSKSASENNIGLKYGSVNARVKRIGALKTKFNITTPVATSSVRGTNEDVGYGPLSGMFIRVNEGSIGATDNNGGSRIVSGRSLYQLLWGNVRPENLASGLRNNSITLFHLGNITDEEKDALNKYGDQITDNFEDNANFLDTVAGRLTTVTVDLQWQPY